MAASEKLAKRKSIESRTNGVDHGMTFIYFREERTSLTRTDEVFSGVINNRRKRFSEQIEPSPYPPGGLATNSAHLASKTLQDLHHPQPPIAITHVDIRQRVLS